VARVGEAFVDIKPNLDGFENTLSKGVGDAVEKTGQKISKVGGTLTKSVTLPIVGVGTAMFAAATSVDSALKDIRVGTGATGSTLAQLETDFAAVASGSSASIDRVGTTIADLNTRLGLTGQPMQNLAGQILDLEQITGGTAVNLDTLTRVFGAFQVGPEQYGETLDKLFRASQATGVEFNDLQGLLVSQSAAFGELGFSMDDTVAILGQFEKAGVNTETVLGGLRASIMKAAGEGEDAASFFRAGVGTIEDFLAAGDEAGAQAAAKELFGARGFLDALDAIRRGQFNIDDTVSQIVNGGDSISGLADETKTFGDDFAEFKNKMTLSLAPLGQKLIPLLTQALETIVPVIITLVDKFANMDPTLLKVVGAIAGVMAVLGPILIVVGKVVIIVGKLAGAFAFFLSPVGLVIAAIAAVIAIIVIVVKNFDTIKEVLSKVAEAIGAFISGAIQAIKDAFNAVWETVKAVAQGILDAFVAAFDFLVDFFTSTLSAIAEVFTIVFQAIHDFINAIVDGIKSAVTTAFNAIKDFISTVMDTIKEVISAVLDFVLWYWTTILNFILDAVKFVFNAVKDFITTVINTVLTVITTVLGKIRDVFSRIMNTIRDVVFGAFQKVKDIVVLVLTELFDRVKRGLGVIRDLFVNTFNGIVDFFSGVVTTLARVGKNIFGFVKDSFKEALNFVIKGWNSLRFTIPSFGVGPVKFPGFELGVPSIPLLANGAIVTKPMLAGIGEAGPEAVIPISRPARAMQLMEQSGLANMVRGQGGFGGPLVNIQNAEFNSGVDADLMAQSVLVAIGERGFAA
jgi:phage-related minor tail protein